MVSFTLALWILAGLLNIGGAFLIALPDIPRVRLILWSERVREGLYQIESTGLKEGSVGYKELAPIFEQRYGIEFPNNTWALRSGFYTMSRYGFEAIYLFTDPDDEGKQIPLGKETGAELDYRVVRNQIRHQIKRDEATVRGIGLVTLGCGFAVQLLL